MLITVKQIDIDAGIKSDCERCPLALAFERAGLGVPHVGRMPSGAVVAFGASHRIRDYWHYLPEQATDFLLRFDRGQAVRPFSFEFDLPTEAQR